MARASNTGDSPLLLVCGEDDYSVNLRAREVFQKWRKEMVSADEEVIDAAVARVSEALACIRRIHEGLNTLPFFGTGKLIWVQKCNFLSTDKVSESKSVSEAVAELAGVIKILDTSNLRVLVSAGKVDKRRTFYKTFEKQGFVEGFESWSVDQKDWAERAEVLVRKSVAERGKIIEDTAAAELVARVGPNPRQLVSEVEKLTLYVAEREQLNASDVAEVCSSNKNARAFAIGEALGNRDLQSALRCLDEELWEIKLDPQKSEIGLLYGIISKVRSMLLLKEMSKEGWVKPGMEYNRMKAELAKVPPEVLPTDKRFNPVAMHPFVLHKALPQVKNYTTDELTAAIEILLQCNIAMVSSSADTASLLQQALVKIVGKSTN